MAHAFNSSTQETKAVDLRGRGQPGLWSKVYTDKPYLEEKIKGGGVG